jgi:hypothetical protein
MRKTVGACFALVMLGSWALAGCGSIPGLHHDGAAKAAVKPKDCTKGGLGCPPTDRRQYYDQRTARYYYFDTQTGRYYWENGDPRF